MPTPIPKVQGGGLFDPSINPVNPFAPPDQRAPQQGMHDQAGNTPINRNPVSDGTAAARDTAVEIPVFLAKISNPGLWSRIGIGAVGVVLIVIVAIVFFKEESSNMIGKVLHG